MTSSAKSGEMKWRTCITCERTTTRRCEECDFIAYCSSKCQASDAARHRPHECVTMTRGERAVYTEVNRMFDECLIPFKYKHTGHKVKGFGVFTTEPVFRGTKILKEKSFLSAGMHEYEAIPVVLRDTDVFDSFWSLDHDKSLPTSKEREMSVVRKNGISSFDTNVHLTYVISRFNHSCSPNVSVITNPATSSHLMIALRDIMEGEEVCTCPYGITDLDVHTRSILYYAVHGTNCFCLKCGSDRPSLT